MVLQSTAGLLTDDELNAAAQALQKGKIYVSPDVHGVSAAELQRYVGDNDVAIVVVPANATINGGTAGFATTLAGQSGHKTVIVAAGRDLEAVSVDLPRGQASQIANSAEANTTSLPAALQKTVADIQTARTTTSQTMPREPEGSSVPAVGGGLLGLALLMAVGALLWRRRVRGGQLPVQATVPNNLARSPQMQKFEKAAAQLETEVKKIPADRPEHSKDMLRVLELMRESVELNSQTQPLNVFEREVDDRVRDLGEMCVAVGAYLSSERHRDLPGYKGRKEVYGTAFHNFRAAAEKETDMSLQQILEEMRFGLNRWTPASEQPSTITLDPPMPQ